MTRFLLTLALLLGFAASACAQETSPDVTQQAYSDLKVWIEAHGDDIAEVAKSESSALYAETIRWGVVNGSIGVAVGVGLWVISAGLFYVARRAAIRLSEKLSSPNLLDDGVPEGLTAMFSSIGGLAAFLFGGGCVCAGLYEAAFALTAPRLYVLDQISNLF